MNERPGPTGKFPKGKIADDDEGELQIGLAIDPDSGNVIINFGKKVDWLGLDADACFRFAMLLLEKSRQAARWEDEHKQSN